MIPAPLSTALSNLLRDAEWSLHPSPLQPRGNWDECWQHSSLTVRVGREASNPWALPSYLEHRGEQLFQLTLVFKVASD